MVVKTRARLPCYSCNTSSTRPASSACSSCLRRRIVGLHPCQHLPEHQHLAVAGQRQAHAVDVGRSPDFAVLDAAQNRMILLARSRSCRACFASRGRPWWLTHVSPSTCLPKPPPSPAPCCSNSSSASVLFVLECEGVRGGAHADDRPARFDVVDDVLHLLVGQIAEAVKMIIRSAVLSASRPGCCRYCSG